MSNPLSLAHAAHANSSCQETEAHDHLKAQHNSLLQAASSCNIAKAFAVTLLPEVAVGRGFLVSVKSDNQESH